ncbi:hypothetical protein ACFSKS_10410 [Pseudocitrobacter faecalis]
MRRITTLLAQMTLEEKVGQLVQLSGEFLSTSLSLLLAQKRSLASASNRFSVLARF